MGAFQIKQALIWGNNMIRNFQDADINAAAKIWLDANIQAHNFIPAQYWERNFEPVKGMLPQAEVYVFEQGENHDLQGFIGLNGDYIAGIFVRGEAQSQGIGKQLLDFAKARKGRLTLNVYRQNARAVKFYQREGFLVQQEGIDDDTGEAEYLMAWNP